MIMLARQKGVGITPPLHSELIMVLKLVLVLTSSNEVHKGGLSSYGLCLMVCGSGLKAHPRHLHCTGLCVHTPCKGVWH